MLRKLGGVVVGAVVALLLIVVLERAIRYVFPPPPLDYSDPDVRRLLAMNAPAGSLISVIVAYAFAALAGAWTAVRVARDGAWPAWAVGGLLLLQTVLNVVSLPHPLWFTVLALAAIAAAAWTAGQLASGAPLVPGRRSHV